ncbi:MAG: DUF5916 domain-containing protein [Saprospiraceae bacterium]
MRFLSILSFVLFTLFLNAQSVSHHTATIKADGVLDEAVWQQIEPLSGFHNFFPINDGLAAMDTEVRIYQDGKYLNIAFTYQDTLADVRISSLKRDNYAAGFHYSDCVGVVIDPYNNQNRGYLFSLNGAGSQLEALIANYDNEDLSWDAIWTSGVGVEGKTKVYEMQIPLSAISYDANVSEWSFQFYTRDAKDRMYTVWNKFERGFLQYDTRFLKKMTMENLQPTKTARTMLIPSLTAGYQKDVVENTNQSNLQPSLDLQQKIGDGLRLDLTLNPDFSQVDVDQQVTNLTRFNIVFPERRNFFIENSDMFTTLGAASNINPFYSRFIGADEDILLGAKLSGNVSPNTRIGILNVQSKKGDSATAQNYTVASIKQQFNPIINATAYLVNRQATTVEDDQADYNRVAGLKVNYLSKNRKWSGFATGSGSFNDGIKGNNQAFSIENNYNTRTLSFSTKVNRVGENYLTDVGFVPRIYNFDALRGETIRAGYTELVQSVFYQHYPKNQDKIQTFRPLNFRINNYWNDNGERFETKLFYNTALFFANQMSVYINTYHDDIQLQYAFDPLRNGEFILPDNYKNSAVRLGYNSDYTRDFYGSVTAQLGTFFGGNRTRYSITTGYRLLPVMSLELNYEYNTLNFSEQGNRNLHLLGLTTEVFFNNALNWTTYVQYNQQINNFNINSRLQWEYQPLSFVYLVFSDNYNSVWERKNWGVSLKVNKRFQL